MKHSILPFTVVAIAVVGCSDGQPVPQKVADGNARGAVAPRQNREPSKDGPARPAAWCASISPDGKRAVSTSGDRIILWRLADAKILNVMKSAPERAIPAGAYDRRRGTISCMDVNWQTGTLITGDWTATVRVWDLEKGNLRVSIDAHPFFPDALWGQVSALALSPDSKLIYSSGHEVDKGQLVKVWDARTGRHLRTIARMEKDLTSEYGRIIALDGNKLLLWSTRLEVTLWDLGEDKRIWQKGGA